MFFVSYLLIFLISICFSQKTRAEPMSSALVVYFSVRTEIVVIVMLKHGIVYADYVKIFEIQ